MNDEGGNDQLIQAFTIRWFLLLFGIPMSYAIARYHVFSQVEWSHFPLFVANKAISLAAVVFIGASYLIGKTIRVYDDDHRRRLILIKFCGLMGFSLATIHTMMALLLFTPANYAKFFLDSGRMNLNGELTMALGVVSLWCLAITALTSLPFMYESIGAERWQRGQRMGYLSLALAGGHTVVMGFSGWLAPAGWPGSMPPISMVAFIAAMIPLLVKLLWTATPR